MATQASKTIAPNKSSKKEVKPNPADGVFLDKFFTLSLDMCLILGFDGYFKQLNPMCEQILGFTTKKFLSEPWMQFIHPEDQPSTLKQLQILMSGKQTIQFENRFRCQDGSYKWLLWNATPCPEQKLIYAVVRDHSECKQAEAAQWQNEELFRLLVEGTNDYAIVMLDPQGNIVSWNAGAERIKRYTAAEIINRHVSCFYTQEDIELGKPARGLEIAANQGRFEDEGWRVRKDGSKFWANVVITPLCNAQKQLLGFVRVTRDITERKLAEEALQRANDQLEKRVEERTAELTKANQLLKQEIAERKRTETALRQSKTRLKNKTQQLEAETQHAKALLTELQRTQSQLFQTEKMSSLGQLVAGIAHEINNPVGFIYGNIDYANCYIKDLMRLMKLYSTHYPQPVDPIQAELAIMDFDFLMTDMPKLLSSMKVGANRLRQIVLSLQNFLRAEQTEMKPIDLLEGLDSTLLLLQNRLKATDVRPAITVHKDCSALPLVECYAGQLNQVFMNILTNAIDVLDVPVETPNTSPVIIISTSVKDLIREGSGVEKIPHAIIQIADNGLGMTEEVLRRAFDPFFTTKVVGKGPGLGLSISYQIVVEKHGGLLTCVSELGKGTEFSIALPIQQYDMLPTMSKDEVEQADLTSPAFR